MKEYFDAIIRLAEIWFQKNVKLELIRILSAFSAE